MSVKYKFVARDGNTVTLDEVDRMVCKEIGLPVNEERYCMDFMMIAEFGLGLLMKHGGSVVTTDIYDESMKEFEIEPWREKLYKKYLCGELTYHAWR